MTTTPQVRRVLEAIADICETLAAGARQLAEGQDLEAEETLMDAGEELRNAPYHAPGE